MLDSFGVTFRFEIQTRFRALLEKIPQRLGKVVLGPSSAFDHSDEQIVRAVQLDDYYRELLHQHLQHDLPINYLTMRLTNLDHLHSWARKVPPLDSSLEIIEYCRTVHFQEGRALLM